MTDTSTYTPALIRELPPKQIAKLREEHERDYANWSGTRSYMVAWEVLALLDAYEAVVAERDKAREELSIWKSVFPDIAPQSVLADRSLIETALAEKAAETERLRGALSEVRQWIDGWGADFTEDDDWPPTQAKMDAALEPALSPTGGE